MKILIDARTLGKRPSGVGMYLYNFICGLMQYDTMEMELQHYMHMDKKY